MSSVNDRQLPHRTPEPIPPPHKNYGTGYDKDKTRIRALLDALRESLTETPDP